VQRPSRRHPSHCSPQHRLCRLCSLNSLSDSNPGKPTNLDQHLSASPRHVHCPERHDLAATRPYMHATGPRSTFGSMYCTNLPLRPEPAPGIQPTGPCPPTHFCTRPSFHLQLLDRGRKTHKHRHICSLVPTRTTAICAGAHHLACAPSIAHPGSPRRPVCVFAV